MMYKIRSLILLGCLCGFLFWSGCTRGGNNSMGPASFSGDTESVLITSSPGVGAPAASSSAKNYSYAESACSISHAVKSGPGLKPGRLRIRVTGNSVPGNVFLTLADMVVKDASGKPWEIPIDSQEIDLKTASAPTKLLGEANLPYGNYRYLEFRVASGRILSAGTSCPLTIPSSRVRFLGRFSIQNGFATELTIKFPEKTLQIAGKGNNGQKSPAQKYIFNPVIQLSSAMIVLPLPVTEGDISGILVDYVKKTPLIGFSLSITGPASLTTSTDSTGAFHFPNLQPGTYTLTMNHPDYLEKIVPVTVFSGQTAIVAAEMNPAVIRSTVANTGWFSEIYPLADAHGRYGEVALETSVTIDFTSLAFTKVELSLEGGYHTTGAGQYSLYLNPSQQVQIITNLGSWWVGNDATPGSLLGQFYATTPPTYYTLDVTDFVRNNPSANYFLAAKNLDLVDIRLSNIQMIINYR